MRVWIGLHSFLLGTYVYRTMLKLRQHTGLIRALSLRLTNISSRAISGYQRSPAPSQGQSQSARLMLRALLIRLDPFGVLVVPMRIRKHTFGSVLWVVILAVFAAHVVLSALTYSDHLKLTYTSVCVLQFASYLFTAPSVYNDAQSCDSRGYLEHSWGTMW